MTLNGVMAVNCMITLNALAFKANCITLVKPYCLQQKYTAKKLVFCNILFIAIFKEITKKCVNKRHHFVKGSNSTNTVQ